VELALVADAPPVPISYAVGPFSLSPAGFWAGWRCRLAGVSGSVPLQTFWQAGYEGMIGV
jgi:hypothetical protein